MLITLLLICEDGLLRVADPSYVEACQQHIISHYYNCDIDVANDTEIINNRTWLTCPTYIGIIRVLNTLYNYKKYNKIDVFGFIAVLRTIIFSLETCGNSFCRRDC